MNKENVVYVNGRISYSQKDWSLDIYNKVTEPINHYAK